MILSFISPDSNYLCNCKVAVTGSSERDTKRMLRWFPKESLKRTNKRKTSAKFKKVNCDGGAYISFLF